MMEDERLEESIRFVRLATSHPYDQRSNDQDLYRQAARAVMADLTSRGGFDPDINNDIRVEIIDDLADILRVTLGDYFADRVAAFIEGRSKLREGDRHDK